MDYVDSIFLLVFRMLHLQIRAFIQISASIDHDVIWQMIFLFAVTISKSVKGDCSRGLSRIVRNVFNEEILVHFTEQQVSPPMSCPLSMHQDMFGIQEAHKTSESASKWTCGFCGKSFYDERFLDKHLDARHVEHSAKGEHISCLADYCDIFRCDIISGRVKPHFWDLALCKEFEMVALLNKCQHMADLCVPKELNNTQQEVLLGYFNQSLCSYLTCERFWETTDNETPRQKTVLYIVGTVFITFILFVYYFVAYTHFYTDDSILEGSRRRRCRQKEMMSKRVYHEHPRQRTNIRRDFR